MKSASCRNARFFPLLGIKKPNHRKKLKAEIVKLNIQDGLPNYIPPSLDEFLIMVRLHEYRGLLANQGYLTIDDLIQISIEDLEDIGIYRLGHQKRLLLAIKRAKDLKSGRRIAQYPTSASSAASNNVVRQPPPRLPPVQPPQVPVPQPSPSQQSQHSMSSFQSSQSSLNGSRTNLASNSATAKAIMEPYRPVYQPEVIRIERAPSVTSVVRPPSCSPSPPPPPPPQMASEPSVGMPAPMAPLSFQRYQPTFQYPQPPSWNGHATIGGHASLGPRSYDDVDIALSHRNPERILMHQHSASNLTASGGTLPRLGKGYVQNCKPRPVAKIVAKTREQPAAPMISNSSNSLSDLDPKMHQQFMFNKQNGAGKTCSDSQVSICIYYLLGCNYYIQFAHLRFSSDRDLLSATCNPLSSQRS